MEMYFRRGRGPGRGSGRGIGKGGRKLGIRGGLVDKNNLPGPRSTVGREARKARREDWTSWCKNYTRATNDLIKKSKKDFVKCTECQELVGKTVFDKHRTRNCVNLDPKLKLCNWDLANYL